MKIIYSQWIFTAHVGLAKWGLRLTQKTTILPTSISEIHGQVSGWSFIVPWGGSLTSRRAPWSGAWVYEWSW